MEQQNVAIPAAPESPAANPDARFGHAMMHRIEDMHALYRKKRSELICQQWAAFLIELCFLSTMILFSCIYGITISPTALQYIILGGLWCRLFIVRVLVILVASNRKGVIKSLKPVSLSVIGLLLDATLLIVIIYYFMEVENMGEVWENFASGDFEAGFAAVMMLYGCMVSLKFLWYLLSVAYWLLVSRKANSEAEIKNSIRQSLLVGGNEDILRVQEEPKNVPLTAKEEIANMINQLVEIRFRKSTYQGILQECPICYMEYEDDDEITPLPCDARHYFHYKCICVWLEKRNCCPLCETPVPKSFRHNYRASVLRNSLIKWGKKSDLNNGL